MTGEVRGARGEVAVNEAEQNTRASPGEFAGRPRWEWPSVIGVLLIAAAFRFLALTDVPPGLHHDEVIIGQIAKDILRGHVAIYFTPGYGHEPLYHYLLAGFFAAMGANAFVLRLTSAFIAMLGLAMSYRFVRLIFSPAVAIGTLAWMAVSLWPVFFARVGLRGIALPLFTILTAYFLWKALSASRFTFYGLAGIFLGLSIYTYQASRVFPIIFAVFFAYLFIVRRWSKSSSFTPHPSSFIPHPSSLNWRPIAVFFLTALIVTAPLILYLTVINPSAESRVAELSGPLNKLRAGDPSEVIGSTLNTLGMFTFRGDAVPIYNVSGRPVFPEIVGAVLFVVGLLICLWRWKRPAYALMLLWFFISLTPAMVTPFSPNFVRTIAAWPTPFVFAGLAMDEVVRFARARGANQQPHRGASQSVVSIQQSVVSIQQPHRGASQSVVSNQQSVVRNQKLIMGFLALVLAFNAALTARDYFVEWPTGDYVRFWQQATWTQAVRTLNADPSTAPIAASGLSIQDFDPQTFDLLGLRSDLKVKWFDCRNAMLYPQDGMTTRYLSPPSFPCDADLQARFWAGAKMVAQPHWPGTNDVIFTLHELNGRTALESALNGSAPRPIWIGGETFDRENPESDLEPAHLPFELGGLALLGWGTDRETVKPGDTIDVFTFWEVTGPIAPPLKIFVHVTSPEGKIVTQWDGLDVGIGSLEAHDVFVQRHRLDLPGDLLPGPYRLSIGAYHPDTGARLKANFAGQEIDSIVLGMLDVR